MRQLKYVNSEREEINFRDYDTQVYKANLHHFGWSPQGVEQRYGLKVDRYAKEPLEYEMIVAARGSKAEKSLNKITDIFELDTIKGVQGRLYFGDYYIDCNLIESSTSPSEDFSGAEKTLKIFAPRAFWIREVTKSFLKSGMRTSALGLDDDLDYPYGYPYDYSPAESGVEKWKINHYAPSEFTMTIYGPCVNPLVSIDGYPYRVYDTLEEREYLIIDSRDHTVIKHRSNGTLANVYDLRGKEHSVFRAIPSGDLSVIWSGAFGFDITLFNERSEPKW